MRTVCAALLALLVAACGSSDPGKLAAVRDRGAWRLQDIPDKRIP